MDHGGCALNVGVKAGRIETIKGDPDGYLNKGYICPKGLASADRLTHPLRLKHPLKRKGIDISCRTKLYACDLLRNLPKMVVFQS